MNCSEDFIFKEYENCNLCPRMCGVNRYKTQNGYCKSSAELVAARAALHMWEEPCISGKNGSGAVFFTGCNLRCVFCQNYSISGGDIGEKITIDRLADIFIELQEKGANNINLVTPTHYVPGIIAAIDMAKKRGLHLPVVYNSSGYESLDTLKMLDGYVDIYLPDYKYIDDDMAKKYSNVNNYSEIASAAIAEMVRQTGSPIFDNDIMVRGTIVRHLVMPNYRDNSYGVIRYLYETYGDNIYISIMNQYTPVTDLKSYPEINRKLTRYEYDKVVDYAIDLGVKNGFIQNGKTASESFIPAFDITGIL